MEERTNTAYDLKGVPWVQGLHQYIYTRGQTRNVFGREAIWPIPPTSTGIEYYLCKGVREFLRRITYHLFVALEELSHEAQRTALEYSLLMFSDVRVGAGYLVLGISTTRPDSVGSPSHSHRGRPPSRTLDCSWPKDRNIKSARGAEKMP